MLDELEVELLELDVDELVELLELELELESCELEFEFELASCFFSWPGGVPCGFPASAAPATAPAETHNANAAAAPRMRRFMGRLLLDRKW